MEVNKSHLISAGIGFLMGVCVSFGVIGIFDLCSRPNAAAPAEVRYETTEMSPNNSLKPDYGRCQAITKKGTQCSRKAKSNGFCFQHGGE